MGGDLDHRLMAVSEGKLWGLYNAAGKQILPVKYESISLVCFGSDKMLAVKLNGKYALYNLDQKISEFIYDEMYCQTQNSAYIRIGDRKGELFFDGREIWK